MSNYVDFADGDFIVYDTTLDDIYVALIIIIIAGAQIFRHLRK